MQFSCNVLFQVFLTVKLDETVPWKWCVRECVCAAYRIHVRHCVRVYQRTASHNT